MENKIIKTGHSAQSGVIDGVVKATGAIIKSLGPSGKGILFNDGFAYQVTRDGATIAKNIKFKDPQEDAGAEFVKKAASLTEDSAGDGSSSTSLLVREFCLRGQKAVSNGANVNELKTGMLKASRWVVDYVKKNSTQIDGDLDKIRQVATISANNDPEVGDIVIEGMKKVGINGLITVESSSSLDTTIDVTTGIKLDRGWASPQYITTPEDGKCTMENPYILVAGERISSVAQVINLLEDFQHNAAGAPLLIICDDIDESVNTMFVVNTLRGAIRACVVKGIDYGDNRKNIMEDIAVAVGAVHLCPENGETLGQANMSHLGKAEKVVVSRDNCIIYRGYGNPEEIAERAEAIRNRMQSKDVNEYDKTKFEKRLANLTGGIAVIRAGGASELETMNRKATIEDAVLAAKSAVEEGYAPGGGYVYFQAAREIAKDREFWKDMTEDEKEGAIIVQKALPVVLKTIAENSGENGEVILKQQEKTRAENVGFNAKTKKFENLIDSGILDSAKVLRVAIENSISISSMILLIDCAVIPEEEKKEGQ